MLDHYRVVRFKNFFHKFVIREVMICMSMCERKDRSTTIGKHGGTCFLQEDDISLRIRRMKQGGVDLVDRFSEEIQRLLHEKTKVRSED